MKTPQFPRRFAHHAMHNLEKSDEAKSPWRCGQHAMQILDDKAQRLILKPQPLHKIYWPNFGL